MVGPANGSKTPKKPLIFYYAVTLVVLMLLNWLLFPMLAQRQVTEVGYDEFLSMVDDGRVETVAYDKQEEQLRSIKPASFRIRIWSSACWTQTA